MQPSKNFVMSVYGKNVQTILTNKAYRKQTKLFELIALIHSHIYSKQFHTKQIIPIAQEILKDAGI